MNGRAWTPGGGGTGGQSAALQSMSLTSIPSMPLSGKGISMYDEVVDEVKHFFMPNSGAEP